MDKIVRIKTFSKQEMRREMPQNKYHYIWKAGLFFSLAIWHLWNEKD
jgi:hypothetical protein